MRAAAEHLTPLTLEPGGKLPTIIEADSGGIGNSGLGQYRSEWVSGIFQAEAGLHPGAANDGGHDASSIQTQLPTGPSLAVAAAAILMGVLKSAIQLDSPFQERYSIAILCELSVGQ